MEKVYGREGEKAMEDVDSGLSASYNHDKGKIGLEIPSGSKDRSE